MRLIAHRGFAGEGPENTLAAVRRAVGQADAVEVDARRCASGEVVVLHDETVDGVTDGTGRVAEHTREELAALSVLGSGEGVPTLEAVASAVPDGVGLVVELKESGIAGDALEAAAGVEDLVVSSFQPDALAECRQRAPEVPLALNVVGVEGGATDGGGDADVPGAAGLALARDLGCAAVHPHHGLCTAGYVERAHDAGFDVNAWTVVDRATAGELAAAGVDGVIADRSDVLG